MKNKEKISKLLYAYTNLIILIFFISNNKKLFDKSIYITKQCLFRILELKFFSLELL